MVRPYFQQFPKLLYTIRWGFFAPLTLDRDRDFAEIAARNRITKS